MNPPSAMLVLLSILAGCALAAQPGANGTLAKVLGHPLRGAVVSFTIGWVVLLGLAVFLQVGWPRWQQVRSVPWWGWTGGFFGAWMVTVSLLAGPKMGATLFFAFVVSSQLVIALLLDHYGWMGYQPIPVTSGRLLGIGLLIAGLITVHLSTNRSRVDRVQAVQGGSGNVEPSLSRDGEPIDRMDPSREE
jgi:transporter family-2 protein